MKNRAQWENWINLFLGAWVFIIPWAIEHDMTVGFMAAAMWNFWIVGGVVFVLAAFAIREIQPWEEWVNMILGIWLFLSPWIFSYSMNSALLWNSLIVGLSIAVLSGLSLPVAQRQHRSIP